MPISYKVVCSKVPNIYCEGLVVCSVVVCIHVAKIHLIRAEPNQNAAVRGHDRKGKPSRRQINRFIPLLFKVHFRVS